MEKEKIISQSLGEEIIEWIEYHCYVPEGALVGQSVKLRDWQRKEIKKIYDNPRRTRRAILSFGRKNGKTALAAFLLLVHLCGPMAVENSTMYSAAQSREQAAILFTLAAKIVRISPILSQYVGIRDTAKELYCEGLGTKYKALSADATTAYGLSPVFIVHDELGQVRGPRSELYEALETATGAQAQPLSIIISTQAATDNDLLSILIDDAKLAEDPRVTVSLYTADPEDNPFVEETIRKANPAFGDFQNAEEVLAMAEDARRMPARENEYRNLILNQRVESHSPFISRAAWEACKGEVPDDWSDMEEIYCGLDLSETTDLTAYIIVGRKDNKYYVRPIFWLPEEGLRERSMADRVPYDVWAKKEKLMLSPGPVIEYEWVAEEIRDIYEGEEIDATAFDRYNFKHLKPWLEKAEMYDEDIERFIPFGQGYVSMSPALRELESLILAKRIVHDDHPVLNMCMSNAVVRKDPAGNRKLDKAKSKGRIDGAVSLIMAIGAFALDENEEEDEPELFFLE